MPHRQFPTLGLDRDDPRCAPRTLSAGPRLTNKDLGCQHKMRCSIPNPTSIETGIILLLRFRAAFV